MKIEDLKEGDILYGYGNKYYTLILFTVIDVDYVDEGEYSYYNVFIADDVLGKRTLQFFIDIPMTKDYEDGVFYKIFLDMKQAVDGLMSDIDKKIGELNDIKELYSNLKL